MKRLTRLLGLLLLLAPAAAQAEWFEASSTHFLVYAEGNAESVRAFATKLERFDKGMRVLNQIPDEDRGPANRVTVYVVSNVGTVQRLARAGSNIAGFYVPRAEGSIAFTPRRVGSGGRWDLDAETVLLHEYAHHFMMQNFPGAFPAWLVEGFAEYYSTTRFEKDGSVAFGIVANHRAWELVGVEPQPIEALFASSGQVSKNVREMATIYGRGWLLTHFLTFERSRKGQLNAYLAALNRGTPSVEAARLAFGDLRRLDGELKAYLKRRTLSYVSLAPERLPIGAVSVRPLSAGEEAILPLRMQSARGVNTEQAKALVVKMRRAAAPFPADAAVQAALAEAEYDAGNQSEADAAADRAIAADPANVHALIYKGRVALARAALDSSGAEAPWKEARKPLLAANRIDPNDPEPLILFYESFGAQGIVPTRNAVAGLLRAFELAPQDRRLRLVVAHQYLVDGKGPDARATLAPLAFDPHGGAMGQAMRAIIAKIDEGGAAAALAEWRKASEAEAETPGAGEPEGDKEERR